MKKMMTIFLLYFFLPIIVNAQWVGNTGVNTKLVLNGNSPQNISAVGDEQGGGFIVWQDDRTGNDKVYFLHFDDRGKPTLRADGKNISTRGGKQLNPLLSSSIQNSAIVLWVGETNKNKPELFIQRVAQNGKLLWNDVGLQITDSENEIRNYYLYCDSEGNSYITYLTKEPGFLGDYIVHLKKINPGGKIISTAENTIVYKSNNRKSSSSIIQEDNGGTFSFWLENVSGKSVLKGLYLDSKKSLSDQQNPVTISYPEKNVLSYKIVKYKNDNAYVVWQQQENEKIIYHQLINSNGKRLWGIYGKKVSYSKGNKTNLQACVNGKDIFVSWTNEIKNQRRVSLQKFDENGNAYWNDELDLSDSSANQFGQKMMITERDRIILSWFQKEFDSVYANIYAMQFSSNGERLWENGMLGVATNFNSHKSYLSAFPDKDGGGIFVFKDKRSGEYGIYGQRIFASGTFVSQMVGCLVNVDGDSVNISWHSVNEEDSTYYIIERTDQPDSNISEWTIIDSISSIYKKGLSEYTVTDNPGLNGTLYYRVTHKNRNGVILSSEISRTNYLRSPSEIVVTQNSPNPFNDSTRIIFFLPEESEISLKIFNSRLKLIQEINKLFPEGKNEIFYSAENRKPGIYFYKFTAGNFVDVKKMVITK